MKVNIDEGTFNKAISEGKLELANWLLLNSCPYDLSVYVQNLNLQVLNWLKSKDIDIPKNCLSDVIDKSSDLAVISWFISNGVSVNHSALNSCIRNKKNELLFHLMEQSNLTLNYESFKTAILAENITVLDYLKTGSLTIDENITELAMKSKKKLSLKWLVLNNLF
jgi:hypothetical protein